MGIDKEKCGASVMTFQTCISEGSLNGLNQGSSVTNVFLFFFLLMYFLMRLIPQLSHCPGSLLLPQLSQFVYIRFSHLSSEAVIIFHYSMANHGISS